MKRKSLLIILVSALLISLSLPSAITTVEAKEQQEKIKLKNFYITLSYNPDEEKIIKKQYEKSARIEVIDKKTGEVKRAYGEIVEDTLSGEYSATDFQTLGTYQLITIYEEQTII